MSSVYCFADHANEESSSCIVPRAKYAVVYSTAAYFTCIYALCTPWYLRNTTRPLRGILVDLRTQLYDCVHSCTTAYTTVSPGKVVSTKNCQWKQTRFKHTCYLYSKSHYLNHPMSPTLPNFRYHNNTVAHPTRLTPLAIVMYVLYCSTVRYDPILVPAEGMQFYIRLQPPLAVR